MGTRRLSQDPSAPLNAEQKIAFALLLFLGVGGVVFGFRSFGSAIYRPIQEQLAKYYTGEDVVNANAKDSADREAQKTQDTDSDGLSDYDELYVYKTSPYLTDSDSDGIDDTAEVYGGTDPNCPVGKDCIGIGSSETSAVLSADQNAASIIGGAPGNNSGILQAGQYNFQSPEDVQAFFQAATIQEIRSALLQAGVSQTDLDAMSDEELQTLFNQAVTNASDSGQFDSLTQGGSTQASP